MPIVLFVSSLSIIETSAFVTSRISCAFGPFVVSIPRSTALGPVSLTLPFSPILFQLPVRYMLVSGWYPAIVGRQLYQSSGHSMGFNGDPWPIVGLGSVPVPLVRSIPVTVIKENIDGNTRDHVYIGPWYHGNCGWSSQYEWRRSTNIDVDIHHRHSSCASSKDEQDPEKRAQYDQYKACVCFH